jgi:hypothetical protein
MPPFLVPVAVPAVAAVAAAATTSAAVTTATTAAAATTTVATATTAASPTAAVSTAATATTGAFFFGSGFIDGERATVVLLTVQSGNGRLGFLIRGHFHESKTFAATGFSIVDDLSGNDLAMRAKHLFQFGSIH